MIHKQQGGAIIAFLLIAVTVAFLLYLLAIPFAYVQDEVTDALTGNEAIQENNRTIEELNDYNSWITPIFDNLVFWAFVGFVLIFIVFAVFTDMHPVLLIFVGIGFVVVLIIAAQYANVADSVTDDELLAAKSAEFTMSGILFSNLLPIFLGIIAVVGILIMMAKRGGVVGG